MIRIGSLLLVLLLAACSERGLTPDDLPTRIPSGAAVATANQLTAVAPPAGMRDSVAFPGIDDNLVFLSNWHLDTSLRFEGVFSRTPRQVSARTDLGVWYNQVGNERRVLIEGTGELFGEDETPTREGVRLGGETFLLIDGACLGDAGGDAATIADLRLGDVFGGVTFATPVGEQQIINGQDVWRYEFNADNMLLPLLRLGDDGTINSVTGELWVGMLPPGEPVVVRYYVTLDVENVVLRLFETSLPVTGQLLMRYDLEDVGVDPNITRPNGC